MRPRAYRQLHLSGPAYGFSGYFKPVFLEPEDGEQLTIPAFQDIRFCYCQISERTMLGAFFTVLVPLLAFLTMAAVIGVFVLHK